MTILRRFAIDDRGASAVEYAGLAAMIVGILLVAIQATGVDIASKLTVISNILH